MSGGESTARASSGRGASRLVAAISRRLMNLAPLLSTLSTIVQTSLGVALGFWQRPYPTWLWVGFGSAVLLTTVSGLLGQEQSRTIARLSGEKGQLLDRQSDLLSQLQRLESFKDLVRGMPRDILQEPLCMIAQKIELGTRDQVTLYTLSKRGFVNQASYTRSGLSEAADAIYPSDYGMLIRAWIDGAYAVTDTSRNPERVVRDLGLHGTAELKRLMPKRCYHVCAIREPKHQHPVALLAFDSERAGQFSKALIEGVLADGEVKVLCGLLDRLRRSRLLPDVNFAVQEGF